MQAPFEIVWANSGLLFEVLLAQLPFMVAGALVLVGGYFLARSARGMVRGGLTNRDRTLAQMVAQLVYAGIVVLSILMALWIAIPTIRFSEVFASLGVTGLILGFALRDVLENFVAGILLLWRRPFGIGSQIRSGKFEGVVDEVNFRATVIRSYDGVKVFIPNARVFTEPVENLSGYGARRTTVVMKMDQDGSVALARETILNTLRPMPDVLNDPVPRVLLAEISDWANILHVLYWTEPMSRVLELEIKSTVTEHVALALREVGISLPYPVQTVQLLTTGAGRDGDVTQDTSA